VLSVGCAKRSTVNRLNEELAQKDAEIGRLEGELSTQQQMNEELRSKLSDLMEENRVLIETNKGLTHVTLDGAATFASARATLTASAQQVLDRVWTVMENYSDRWILVEGHTDNQAIRPNFTWKYKSNWELSSARAHSVLHHVLEKYNADPAKIKVVGYGEQHPVASNDSAEGRAANRRVVITIGSKRNVEMHEKNLISSME
jgi:chemotaxis protein MotB